MKHVAHGAGEFGKEVASHALASGAVHLCHEAAQRGFGVALATLMQAGIGVWGPALGAVMLCLGGNIRACCSERAREAELREHFKHLASLLDGIKADSAASLDEFQKLISHESWVQARLDNVEKAEIGGWHRLRKTIPVPPITVPR